MTADSVNPHSYGCFFLFHTRRVIMFYSITSHFLQYKMWHDLWTGFFANLCKTLPK